MSSASAARTALARAFSLRAGASGLVRRAPVGAASGQARLTPLDGLRALSILWLIAFHSAWFCWRLPPPTYVALLHEPALLPLWRGDFGVDVFFVLSGFLIAGMLRDERARTGRVSLRTFYVRRLMRLWPALVAAALLELCASPERAGTAWATLLYLTDFVPVERAFMGWTWSLAIEEQFYLVCPWLLTALAARSLRQELCVLALIALGLVALAAGLVARGPFFAFDAEIAINRPFDLWARAYDALYAKPWMRSAPLLAGVTASLLHRTPTFMQRLARARVLGGIGLAVAVGAAALATHWPLAFGTPRLVEVLYLALYRPIFGIAVAYLLLLAVSEHPLGRAIGRALSARAFYPVAQLAYAAYLVNPVVAMWTHGRFGGGGSPLGAMGLLLPLDLALTFGLAAAVHLLVERPIMQLRPR